MREAGCEDEPRDLRSLASAVLLLHAAFDVFLIIPAALAVL